MGFQPGETGLLRVGHVVGVDEGEAHLPFVTASDSDGRIAEAWPIPIAVSWEWDDNAWSGNHSCDACTLFDTDADGCANFSFCINR